MPFATHMLLALHISNHDTSLRGIVGRGIRCVFETTEGANSHKHEQGSWTCQGSHLQVGHCQRMYGSIWPEHCMHQHHASYTLQALHDVFGIHWLGQPTQAAATIAVLLRKKRIGTARVQPFPRSCKNVQNVPQTASIDSVNKTAKQLWLCILHTLPCQAAALLLENL